mmetsp:Transcript_151/g.447  ORF Transcript_151/g.447 Transcript_151/m.447 type:complete len:464 (-) Transcript_151:65-1456(-)
MVVGHGGAFFILLFTGVVGWLARPSTKEETTKAFRDYRLNFLLAHASFCATESLMGPVGNLLFTQLNFSQVEMGYMFWLASACFWLVGFQGGAVADLFGRKRACLACCACLLGVGVLSHVRSFWCMTAGIFLFNVAQVTYTSASESWLVSEHVVRHGLAGGLLSHMFAMMYVTRSSVAVMMGYLSLFCYLSGTVDRPLFTDSAIHIGGIHAIFELGIVTSAIGIWLMATRWGENAGDAGGKFQLKKHHVGYLWDACKVIWSDPRVALLGVVVTGFSAAQGIYMWHWMPALHTGHEAWRVTLTWTVLSMSNMCGVSLSTLLSSRLGGSFRSTVLLLGACLIVAMLAFAVAACSALQDERRGVCFVALALFSCTSGFFGPVAGVLKGEIVPEDVRTTVYILFAFVGGVFSASQIHVSSDKAFMHCAVALLSALGFLTSLGLRPLPEAAEKGADVETFYQGVSKMV